MRRFQLIILTLLLLQSGIPIYAQTPTPWEQIVPVRTFGYGTLTDVFWSPVNGQLAVASDTGIQFFDESLTLEGERRLPDGQTPHAFSPDLRYVVLQEADGLIVRDTSTWEAIFALDRITPVSWSPDSRLLAVWLDMSVQIWQVETATLVREVTELISEGSNLQWSPDSEVIAVTGPGAIVMLRVRTGDIVRLHDFAIIENFTWSRDGLWLLIIGRKEPLPLDFDYQKALVEHDLLRVDALTGEVVQVYDVRAGQPDSEFYSSTGHISVSPDGRYLAAGLKYAVRYTDEDDIEHLEWRSSGMGIWELDSGAALHATTYENRLDLLYVVWSPDGTHFASSHDATLEVYEVASGKRNDLLAAYISGQRPLVWLSEGLVAAGGLWNVAGEYPEFVDARTIAEPPEDFFQPAPEVVCTNRYTKLCPPKIVFDPTVWDYNRPPWSFELIHHIPERDFAITYEIEIEYPGTPEYEDGEPPYERYVLWDTNTGQRMERYLYMNGRQDAWIYELPEATVVESESRAFNVLRNTYFIAINDDTILNLRTGEEILLQGVQQWEWRETWFSPDEAKLIYAYDTDGRFKTFDPWTGDMLYETVAAPRENLYYSHDYQLSYVVDYQNVTHIYETYTGTKILEIYTGNQTPEYLWNIDRSLVAIGGDNRGIIIVDVINKERLAVLRGHQYAVTSLAWNPDCDYARLETCRYVLASGDVAGNIILWGFPDDLATVHEISEQPAPPMLELPQAVINYSTLEPLWTYVGVVDEYGRVQAHTIRWSSGGISINGNSFYTPEFAPLSERPAAIDWVVPADVRTDGRIVLSGGQVITPDGRIVSEIASYSYSAVDAIFTADGTGILTAHSAPDNTFLGWVREWSAESGRPITRWGGGNPGFSHIEDSPDGQWIATVTDPHYSFTPRAQIWYADRYNTQYSSLIGHYGRIVALYWQGENVITASEDGSVRLWDIHTGKPLARWNHAAGAAVVQMMRVDEDSMILSAGDDLIVLNANMLAVEQTFVGYGGRAFDFSPDKTQIVAIGSDNVVRRIEFDSGDVLSTQNQHQPEISQLEWNPQVEALAVARRDGSIVILDGRTGAQIRMLRPYGMAIRGMSWNPDGTKLLLDLADGTVEILDGNSGDVLTRIENRWRRLGVWWSPDGTKIAFGTYPNPEVSVYNAPSLVQIHDAETGHLLSILDLEWRDYIYYWDKKPFTLSWSPEGERIAAIYHGRLRVWNWESGELLITPRENPGRATGLTLWEGEDTLHIWMTDSTWRLDIPDDELVQIANEGLPVGTLLRGDGGVMLAGTQIVEYNTFYPLQDVGIQYTDAAWHPDCRTADCPAMLAVASGSQVTMFSYPGEE